MELCKIGTYRDRLFKASGKNLFDKSTITDGYRLDGSGVPSGVADNEFTSDFISIEPNATYTRNIGGISAYTRTCFYDNTKTFISKDDSNQTFTTPSNAYYLRFSEYTSRLDTIQLEKGSSSSSYEPYGNYWYKYKAINKVILNGTENWALNGQTTYNNNIHLTISDAKSTTNTSTSTLAMSNYFLGSPTSTTINSATPNLITLISNNRVYVVVAKSDYADVDAFKTWLTTHNTILYYVLNIPIYERITGDLERQLNNVKTLELIDAEYLKDINVNFGEMVKPINTLTLKRSGDTDAISLSIPEDLSDDLKNEISISENQIMNFDDRDTYMKSILGRLYGMSYAINDFNSTGITWLELCDRYNVLITKTDNEGNIIESNIYPCIMFNDEIASVPHRH